MSRLESQALGGYYKTPTNLLPSLASLICFESSPSSIYSGQRHVLCDPAAGDGEALGTMRDRWWPADSYGRGYILACEMEPTRARALAKRFPRAEDQTVNSDAFAVTWPKDAPGCSLLFLNPPYDHDPEHGRLEQRFLARFTTALAPGGALMFIVPVHALAASAKHLGQYFTEIRCWRFPDEEYEAYKQVVIVARRTGAPLVDAPMAAVVEGWAKFPARILPLPRLCPDPLKVPKGEYGLSFYRVNFDRIGTISAYRPWEGMPVGVDLSVGDLVGRVFPTALPPKPAHVALALANGHFNGHRINSDSGDLPSLLVKGMFTKELVEIDRKFDKDGEIKSIVKVQQPSLRMSALRLDNFEFFEPRQTAEAAAAPGVALKDFSIRDILDRYGRSLARLMTQQFPPLHNPGRPDHQMRLPDLPRPPFRVQYHAIQAALKLLATRKNPKFCAEVGTGKTTMALYLWAAMSPRFHAQTVAELERVGIRNPRLPVVRRMLVLCPPHLLDTWTEEVLGDGHKSGVAPWARTKIVRTISDLQEDADIYVMSRENAKLGHGYVGIDGFCPRCGSPLPEDAETNLEKRLRCRAPVHEPWNPWAYMAEDLAAALLRVMPDNDLVVSLTRRHRTLRQRSARRAAAGVDRATVLELMGHRPEHRTGRASVISEIASVLGDKELSWAEWQKPVQVLSHLARALGDEEAVAAALDRVAAAGRKKGEWSPFTYASEGAKNLRTSLGQVTGEEHRLDLYRQALSILMELGEWSGRPDFSLSRHRQRLRPAEGDGEETPKAEVCGEPLFQAVAEPRRFPLAKYIARYMRDRFDLLVLDEAHEFNNLGTAQEKAAHRLAELRLPVVALTGSIMSGYASSLFANWWSLDRTFRQEFERDDLARFVQRYGYRKFVFSPREEKQGGYGRQSDREDMTCRAAGEVPGVLPLFLLKYLLPAGVVVHKEELDLELPPMDELPIELHAETDLDLELLAEYRRITDLLVNAIKADMFSPLSGKLWGAMMELPSYLDRATEDQGRFELRYPKEAGGMLVADGRLFPADYQTPKERALLKFLAEELEMGRRSVVFIRHVTGGLPDRLARIIRGGVTRNVVYLNAQKVPAPKRKEWINEHVIAAGAEVLIVNPNAVRTGLNNLVRFCNAWWHEVDYSAQTYRQANGRFHRVGQERPVHVRFPLYPKTAQAIAVDLVARKVTASLQVDGLSVQGALEAAGSDTTGKAAIEAAMQMGQAIYARLAGVA